MARPLVILCRCFGEIEETIDLAVIQENLERQAPISSVKILDSLCLDRDRRAVASLIRASKEEKVLVAACSSLAR